MKIVNLDAYTIHLDDLHWTDLAKLGDLTTYDRIAQEDVIDAIGTAEVALFTSKVKITREIMDACPNLKFISVTATGYDNIDIAAAKEKGIAVCNVPAYSTESVAQHTFALILEVADNVGLYTRLVHEHRWENSQDYAFIEKPILQLSGRSLGIVGYGTIGKRVAEIAKAFGMTVLGVKRTVVPLENVDEVLPETKMDEAIARAEDRELFEQLLKKLNIPHPEGRTVSSIEQGVEAAKEIGYPVLLRPSFVLGGRAMQIATDEQQLRRYLRTAVEVDADRPVLVDKYIEGKEVEVDAVCDGTDVFLPGIMELVERTGIHSGDSISVYPTFSIAEKVKNTIADYTVRLGLGIGIVGLYNIQFIVAPDQSVYIIEVNPRSSRTVPFLSKATGYGLADIATKVMLGARLRDMGLTGQPKPRSDRWFVKAPAFSFSKLHGMDAYLSPEMKSTGEAIGYDARLTRALYKARLASGMNIVNYGTVLATIADKDKEEALPLIRRFYNLGFNIRATEGTAAFLKQHGIRTHALKKLSQGSGEIPDELRRGYVSYVINTRDMSSSKVMSDGFEIRRCAAENGVTMFSSLDTVRVLLDVLEEMTFRVSTIDA